MDTKKLVGLLESMYDELTECAIDMRELTKVFKNNYTKKRTLTQLAQDVLPFKEASLKDLLDFWMPLWKDEGRVSGRQIRLGPEALLLGFDEESVQDLYDVCKRMILLFC